MKIKIVDAICGQGKTSWAKQKMNTDKDNQYLYVTPFLDEIKKLKEENISFSTPLNLGKSKLTSFDELLLQGRNIATTHSLFSRCSEKEVSYLSARNYTLILDEVMDVIDTLPIEKEDYNILFNQKLVEIDEHGKMKWLNKDYPATGVFREIKSLCNRESVYVVDGICLVWTLPVNLFRCFNNIYILTYDFNNQLQRYYYDMHNVEYEFFSVDNNNGVYSLCDYKKTYPQYESIHICKDTKLNAIGSKEYNGHDTCMSKNWYKNNISSLAVLKNNITNYFIHKCKAKSKDIIWTTFKEYKDILSAKGYTKSFLACNSRASNAYRDRHYLAYTTNVYMNPMIKKFFIYNNIKVNEDAYALSEMLQFIYRSAIRNNEDIYCYIPSKRMRKLLDDANSEYLKVTKPIKNT